MPASFTYFHVELANHALVLAEGVPAETFVDNVERLAFDNWAEHEALYGAGAADPGNGAAARQGAPPGADGDPPAPRGPRRRLLGEAAVAA